MALEESENDDKACNNNSNRITHYDRVSRG